MKAKFSKSWIKSKQPRKQRKFLYNAPLHVKKKFVQANLSKDLQEKSKRRSFGVKVGDKVRLVRGQFKGKTGKVEKVDIKATKIFVAGIEAIKKDGSKVAYPIHPSNLIIEELKLDDKKRKAKFELHNSSKKK